MSHCFDEKQGELQDCSFEQLECSKAVISNKHFESCQFKKCNFNSVKFHKCRFVDCEFIDSDLSLMEVKSSSFSDVVFDACKILGVNWAQANWAGIALSSPIQFYRCNISHSSFFELILPELVIEECKAHEVDFRGADLTRANLVYSDFEKSLFIKTKLNKADFTEAKHYNIDTTMNEIKEAKFSFPEVVNLLNCLDIKVSGLEDH